MAGTGDRISILSIITVQIEGAVIRVRLVIVTARIQGGAVELAVIGNLRENAGAQGVTIPIII